MNNHLPDILIREANNGNNTFEIRKIPCANIFDGILYFLVKILKLQHLWFEASRNRLQEATNTINMSPSEI